MTWGLAIDYGTSFTAAAIVDGSGAVEVLEIEDSPRFPSAVLYGERGLVVGRAALNQARRHPERFERSPKRLIGQPEALLDGHPVAPAEMVAAVLTRVAEAARTRQGQTDPDWVLITHPAGWYEERLDVLRAAAREAGLGEVGFLSEPEAAAWFFAADRRGREPELEPGQSVAVYDLGGGTFDTAILTRDGEAFRIAGTGGEDWFGGEEFDQRLLAHVITLVRGRDQGLADCLESPPDLDWGRTRQQLEQDVRELKEALSKSPRESVAIAIPGGVEDVEVTREEFEQLIRRDLERSVGQLDATIRRSGEHEVAAVYMTGGSSRIPLAASLVQKLHPNTYSRPDPKTLVARGAAMRGPDRAPTTFDGAGAPTLSLPSTSPVDEAPPPLVEEVPPPQPRKPPAEPASVPPKPRERPKRAVQAASQARSWAFLSIVGGAVILIALFLPFTSFEPPGFVSDELWEFEMPLWEARSRGVIAALQAATLIVLAGVIAWGAAGRRELLAGLLAGVLVLAGTLAGSFLNAPLYLDPHVGAWGLAIGSLVAISAGAVAFIRAFPSVARPLADSGATRRAAGVILAGAALLAIAPALPYATDFDVSLLESNDRAWTMLVWPLLAVVGGLWGLLRSALTPVIALLALAALGFGSMIVRAFDWVGTDFGPAAGWYAGGLGALMLLAAGLMVWRAWYSSALVSGEDPAALEDRP